MMSPEQVTEHGRALTELTTLKESNAHLRAQNKELQDTAMQKQREAADALKQLQPLKDQLT